MLLVICLIPPLIFKMYLVFKFEEIIKVKFVLT